MLTMASPVADKRLDKKIVEKEEYSYGFLTSCGTEYVIVFDHAPTLEEQLHWFDYFEVMDCS